MASFGSGLVSGIGAGMDAGREFRDSWNESEADEIAQERARQEQAQQEAAIQVAPPEPQAQPAPETPPAAPQEQTPVTESPVSAPSTEAPAAPASEAPAAEAPPAPAYEAPVPPAAEKPAERAQWVIGEGKHQKAFDHEPSEMELRQWRYDTILDKAGSRYADDYLARAMKRDALARIEKDELDLRGAADDNTGSAPGGLLSPAGMTMDGINMSRRMYIQARIMARTDPAKAMELVKAANKNLAGIALNSYFSGDTDAFARAYNASSQNGHQVGKVAFDPKSGDVIYTDKNGTGRISKDNLFLSARSLYDPDHALSAEEYNRKLAELERNNTLRHDAAEDRIAARNGAAKGAGNAAGNPSAVDMDKLGKKLELWKTKNPDGGEQFGTYYGSRLGTFEPQAVYSTANDMMRIAQQNGQQLAEDDAISLAASHLAAQNARQKVQAEIDAAGSDTAKVKALEAELKTIPQAAYRFTPDGQMVEVAHSGGKNPFTRDIRVINPSMDYDTAKDPAMRTAILTQFQGNAAWKAMADSVFGDGKKLTPEELAGRFGSFRERLGTEARNMVQARDGTPQQMNAAEQQAKDAAVRAWRWLPVYQSAIEAQKKAEAAAKPATAGKPAYVPSEESVAALGTAEEGKSGYTTGIAAAKKVGGMVVDWASENYARNNSPRLAVERWRADKNISQKDSAKIVEYISRFPEAQQEFGIDARQFDFLKGRASGAI